jgi:hypothetical protein
MQKYCMTLVRKITGYMREHGKTMLMQKYRMTLDMQRRKEVAA